MGDKKAGEASSHNQKCFRSRMMTAYDLLRKENHTQKLDRK